MLFKSEMHLLFSELACVPFTRSRVLSSFCNNFHYLLKAQRFLFSTFETSLVCTDGRPKFGKKTAIQPSLTKLKKTYYKIYLSIEV